MIFESCDKEDSYFAESVLEDMLISHQVSEMLDRCNIIYLEEADKDAAAEKSKGLIGKIIDKIMSILNKIGTLIEGILQGFKTAFSSDKKRLTADKYMNSETGQAKLKYDLEKLEAQIDEEYRLARPLIANISNITKIDPAKVEKWCDDLNATLDKGYVEYKDDIVREGKYLAKRGAAKGIANKLLKDTKSVEKLKNETQKHLDNIKRRQDADNIKQDLKLIDKVAASTSKLLSKWYKVANTIMPFV